MIAASLQGFASDQLAAEAVPEPGMAVMFGTMAGLIVWARKRKQTKG